MKSKDTKEIYVAFLRGINVGGHHKVPMAELRKVLEGLQFRNVVTLLNSGNIIFGSLSEDPECLEERISEHLEKTFGFPIPTVVKRSETIKELTGNNPFKDIVLTKDIRLYVTFLRNDVEIEIKFPWACDDNSFKILDKTGKIILSVLDLSISGTPKAMEVLEKYFGNDITTRNWNTVERIAIKLKDNNSEK